MFDSNVPIIEVIDRLQDEVDIAIPIQNTTYVNWINSLEQLLYSEIIKEQAELKYPSEIINPDKTIYISDIKGPTYANKIRFEDIYTIYANDVQLIKTTLTSGQIFPNSFYKVNNGDIGLSFDSEIHSIRIIYFVKPALKSIENKEDTIKIPIEFLDLFTSKLRGEAYKLANEDNLAAKWLNDYNVLLENFKEWIRGKSPQFGM